MPLRYGAGLTPNQFGDPTLTAEEAMSACGPALAVAFAKVNGRNPSLREALDLAKATGWTAAGGMNGVANEQALLGKMGIDARIAAPDTTAIATDVQAGRPVGISTGKHYWVADDYDPATGKLHVGNSGLARKGGAEWMSLDDISRLDGGVNGVLHMSTTPAEMTTGTPVGAPVEQQRFLEQNSPGESTVIAPATQDARGGASRTRVPETASDVEQAATGAQTGQQTTQEQQIPDWLKELMMAGEVSKHVKGLFESTPVPQAPAFRLPGLPELPGWRRSGFQLGGR